MSAEYRVTPAALLYAVMMAGGEQFYGIPDPFSGITEENAESMVAGIEKELADRKLTVMDFDGNTTQDEAFTKALLFCASCNDITGFDCKIRGEEKHITIFRGERVILLETEGEECVLKEMSKEEALAHLMERLALKEDLPLIQTDPVFFDSIMVQTADEKTLMEAGCVEATARLIRKGFQNDAILCFGNRLEGGEEVHAISLLFGEEGVLSMGMYYGNDAEEISFTPVKAEAARQMIATLCD